MIQVAGLEHQVDQPGRTRANERRRDHIGHVEPERQDEYPGRPQAEAVLQEGALRLDVGRPGGECPCYLDFHSLLCSCHLSHLRHAVDPGDAKST